MKSVFLETLETVLVAMVVFLALQASIQNFRVEGYSMEDTLGNGQYLLVNKLVYFRLPSGIIGRVLSAGGEGTSEPSFVFRAPRRGDVVVFRPPRSDDPDYVKRVIGVPGDVVSMHAGQVYINGERLEEPYLTNRDRYTMEPVVVPPESVFVLGDNRPVSADSRGFGTVPWENIVGRAWLIFWPLDQWSVIGAAGEQPSW